MDKKRIIAITVGTAISLLGLLWFLQGSDLVHMKPILCLADCQPITGKSPEWQIAGTIAFIVGVSIIFASMKRSRKTKI